MLGFNCLWLEFQLTSEIIRRRLSAAACFEDLLRWRGLSRWPPDAWEAQALTVQLIWRSLLQDGILTLRGRARRQHIGVIQRSPNSTSLLRAREVLSRFDGLKELRCFELLNDLLVLVLEANATGFLAALPFEDLTSQLAIIRALVVVLLDDEVLPQPPLDGESSTPVPLRGLLVHVRERYLIAVLNGDWGACWGRVLVEERPRKLNLVGLAA